MVALSGQSALAFLQERDPFKRHLMQKIAERHFEHLRLLNDDLAGKIIKRLADAMK